MNINTKPSFVEAKIEQFTGGESETLVIWAPYFKEFLNHLHTIISPESKKNYGRTQT